MKRGGLAEAPNRGTGEASSRATGQIEVAVVSRLKTSHDVGLVSSLASCQTRRILKYAHELTHLHAYRYVFV